LNTQFVSVPDIPSTHFRNVTKLPLLLRNEFNPSLCLYKICDYYYYYHHHHRGGDDDDDDDDDDV